MPRAVSGAVEQIARQTVGKDWSLYAALLDHWQEIVGADYAKVTIPAKITFPHQPMEPRRRSGTLTIKLPKGLAMEFSFKTDQIRQRINGYFGYDAVAKIIFEPVYGTPEAKGPTLKEPDPEELAKVKTGVQDIENDELRAALEAFGAAGLSRTD